MHLEPSDKSRDPGERSHQHPWRPTPEPEAWDDWDLAPPSQLWQPQVWDENDAEPDPEYGDFWPELNDEDA